jgi:SnoaL-like domain
MCATHLIEIVVVLKTTTESAMHEQSMSSLTDEHRDFFERFKSFWVAPSGARVAELIAPEAQIHFTGAGTFSGAEYIEAMQQMLDSLVGLEVTPVDCAGNGDCLYIFWRASTVIEGKRIEYHGVDRFRLSNGMAIEEHVIFDSAALQPAA